MAIAAQWSYFHQRVFPVPCLFLRSPETWEKKDPFYLGFYLRALAPAELSAAESKT